MSKQSELKPCPFCKGTPKRLGHTYNGSFLGMTENHTPKWETKHYYIIKCTKCGISQPKRKYETRQASDDAWNNRE